ncbi:MAG: AsmA-like C-terminal region-containing protein [Bacteroides sp.]|nr:AsmA-like C-terminal region-containing protein [Bacteroides sp.]MCM1084959.1 AsmA-like C-terminal region-containing protein [Bacteroides sp.]
MGRKEIMISEAVFGTPEKRGWKRYALRLTLWFFGIVFALSAALGSYLYCNRTEIKRLFVQEINRNLITPVSVQDIRLRIWKEFPMLSVSFEGVSANGADAQDPEELFRARNIALSFNLRDIFRKQYIVREILIRGGDFNLKHYGQGDYNYLIWKRKDTLAHPVSFHLNKVLLRNTLVRFRDMPGAHDYQVLARNVLAKGDLYREGQVFQLRGDVDIHSMKASGFVFLKEKDAFLDVRFSNEGSEKRFNVQKGIVKVENSAFATTGYVDYGKKRHYMDFSFTGKDLRVETLLGLLPSASRRYIDDYAFKGRLAFNMGIKGDYTRAPLLVHAVFSYADGQVGHKKSNLKATGVNLRGAFTNGTRSKVENCRLVFDTLSAKLPTGTVSGRFSIQNFKNPTISYEGSLSAELAGLQDFLKLLPGYRLHGTADVRLSFAHTFPALNPKSWKAADFSNARTQGFLRLRDFALDFPDGRSLKSERVYVTFEPRAVKTEPFKVLADQTELEARLFVENLLPYLLLKGQSLYATASLKSPGLDWDKLKVWMQRAENTAQRKDTVPSGGSGRGRNLLKDLYADVDVSVDRLYVPDVRISHLKGLLRYSWEDLALEDLRFDALQGDFEGAAAIGRRQDGWSVNLKGRIQDMDISSCFKSFKDFGQKQITYGNIGGIFSADFRLSAKYLNEGNRIDASGLQLWTRLDIRDGVLQNMESLRRVSRFTGEDDLQDIRFATLRNVIEIADGTVSIPEMQVNSSSGNLTFSGTHTFANEVDYLVNIELSDLLSRRRAQRIGNQDEFGVVTGGGSRVRLPLHITGTLPDVEIKYAFNKARQGARERLQENRNELREALRDEYSDMRRKREEKQEQKAQEKRRENGEFIIELEEEGLMEKTSRTPAKTDTVQAKKKKKYKTEDDFRIEFEEE